METLFVSGQLKESLDASREWLTNHLHLNEQVIAANTNLSLLGNEVHVGVNDSDNVLDDESERVLAVYMQSTFELNAPDETLLLADVLRIMSPVPYHVGLFWGSFLSAMGHYTDAQAFFSRTLDALEQQFHNTPDSAIVCRQYEEMFHALVSKVWLGDQVASNAPTLLDLIRNNAVLTPTFKSKLILLVEQRDVESSSSPPPPPPSSSASSPLVPPPPTASHRSPSMQPKSTRTTTATSFLTEPSTQLMLGAAAVAAVCAIKYRSHLHTSMNDVLSTLHEAKGLLFG
ncbi:hypothetical protein DYB30_004423 [Aphanomyces astaci]|uniref:Uncharacterized protein n=1 Tax=Aphanomyces astaci TaxID=112090 RepID=A0A397CCB0_APHAT|nr:hypothetical protein DYB30_004423 [Aphanomyces astaci]